MGVLCTTAENSGLLKKDKRTAVKLKAVPTTSGCLINNALTECDLLRGVNFRLRSQVV